MKKTIIEIKARLEQKTPLMGDELIYLLEDSRRGVQQLLKSYMRRERHRTELISRAEMMWTYEQDCYKKGLTLIAGVDEAGRGPLAGPVVAAAVILPSHFPALGLNDSKKLTRESRDKWRKVIMQEAIAVGIGIGSVTYIDKHNILQATYYAMRQAIGRLSLEPSFILVDGVKIPKLSIPQKGIIKGDSLSHSIAAASIIAKTTRDELMDNYALIHPKYGFHNNMGYATKEHLRALIKEGPCSIHRHSFQPIKEWNDVKLSKTIEKKQVT